MRKVTIAAVSAMTAIAAVLPVSAVANGGQPAPASTVSSVPLSEVVGAGQAAGAVEFDAAAVDTQRPGACRHAWLYIHAVEITARAAPDPYAAKVEQLSGGQIPCRHFQPGGRYEACGAVNTGWILVPIPGQYPRQGWIASQCTGDPIL